MNPTSVDELREKLLSELGADPGAMAMIIEALNEQTDEGKLIDPSGEETSQFKTWGAILGKLAASGLLNPAVEIGKAWYHRLNELQNQHGQRYHKGGAAHNLGVCLSNRGDHASGAWFQTCAFVEDILKHSQRDIPKTRGTTNLRVHYNWGELDFETIASYARATMEHDDELSWFPEVDPIVWTTKRRF
jgi:hypothetical protein